MMNSRQDGHGLPYPNRRSIRLKGYDYSQAGAYFITIVTQDRACLFGEVVEGEMRLNAFGEIVTDEWLRTGQIRPNVVLDAFIVMPNHIHGIIFITVDDPVGATRWVAPRATRWVAPRATRRVAPTSDTHTTRPRGPKPQSIGAIIGQFKSVVTKRINQLRGATGLTVWQRNYYEHIVRDEHSLNRIREYIANNPLQWELDRENPNARAPHVISLQTDEPWRT